MSKRVLGPLQNTATLKKVISHVPQPGRYTNGSFRMGPSLFSQIYIILL